VCVHLASVTRFTLLVFPAKFSAHRYPLIRVRIGKRFWNRIPFVVFADGLILLLISVWCFRSERGSWRCRTRSSRDFVFAGEARAPCGCLRHRRHGNASGPARRGQRARRCRLIRARSHGRFPFLGCGLEMIGGVLSVIFFFSSPFHLACSSCCVVYVWAASVRLSCSSSLDVGSWSKKLRVQKNRSACIWTHTFVEMAVITYKYLCSQRTACSVIIPSMIPSL